MKKTRPLTKTEYLSLRKLYMAYSNALARIMDKTQIDPVIRRELQKTYYKTDFPTKIYYK